MEMSANHEKLRKRTELKFSFGELGRQSCPWQQTGNMSFQCREHYNLNDLSKL